MSVITQISDTISQPLKQPVLGQATELEAEYRCRLVRYHLTDHQLQQKYGVTFAEFEQAQVWAGTNHSWEAESDAIAWETAVDGIETMQRQLYLKI
jgi:hypothetical protein